MIDPKELRVGAHINVSGERVKVWEITNTCLVAYIKPDGDWEAVDPAEDWVEPIPITAELLTELGFLKMEEHGTVSVWMNRNIRIDIIGERMTAMVGIDFQNCTISPIRYLHEIEQFLYLTTKTELINPVISVKPECLKSEPEALGGVYVDESLLDKDIKDLSATELRFLSENGYSVSAEIERRTNQKHKDNEHI